MFIEEVLKQVPRITGLVLMLLALSGNCLFAQTIKEEAPVNKILDSLHWLGHDSFRLDASKTVYFDPWKLAANPPKADIILVSHEHHDHFSLEDIKLISSKDTVIVCDKTVAGQLRGKAVCREIKVLAPGEAAEISGVKIKAVPSYNTAKSFHTKESGKLGYLVTVDGVILYHAGDTDFIPEMKNYSCDIALLPVSGTYVMTADEAAEAALAIGSQTAASWPAALAIKPKIAIPMHWGDIVGSIDDARRFKKLLEGKIEVRIMCPVS